MHVIDVTRIIGVVTDDMFSETPLPYAPFSSRDPRLRGPFSPLNRLNEANLDRLPAIGEIVVS